MNAPLWNCDRSILSKRPVIFSYFNTHQFRFISGDVFSKRFDKSSRFEFENDTERRFILFLCYFCLRGIYFGEISERPVHFECHKSSKRLRFWIDRSCFAMNAGSSLICSDAQIYPKNITFIILMYYPAVNILRGSVIDWFLATWVLNIAKQIRSVRQKWALFETRICVCSYRSYIVF